MQSKYLTIDEVTQFTTDKGRTTCYVDKWTQEATAALATQAGLSRVAFLHRLVESYGAACVEDYTRPLERS